MSRDTTGIGNRQFRTHAIEDRLNGANLSLAVMRVMGFPEGTVIDKDVVIEAHDCSNVNVTMTFVAPVDFNERLAQELDRIVADPTAGRRSPGIPVVDSPYVSVEELPPDEPQPVRRPRVEHYEHPYPSPKEYLSKCGKFENFICGMISEESGVRDMAAHARHAALLRVLAEFGQVFGRPSILTTSPP